MVPKMARPVWGLLFLCWYFISKSDARKNECLARFGDLTHLNFIPAGQTALIGVCAGDDEFACVGRGTGSQQTKNFARNKLRSMTLIVDWNLPGGQSTASTVGNLSGSWTWILLDLVVRRRKYFVIVSRFIQLPVFKPSQFKSFVDKRN